MIPVQPQNEPPCFDRNVRRKGLDWLRKNGLSISGPIPAGVALHPYWKDCLKELHTAYGGVCAYACMYIHPVTGSRSVEHFVAKSRDLGLAYEWSNYRLACGKMNSRKRDFSDVLDPFLLAEGTFHLDLATGSIYANPSLGAAAMQDACDTIMRLSLDDAECRKARTDCYDSYIQGHISSSYLKKENPFVWKEAERQGLL